MVRSTLSSGATTTPCGDRRGAQRVFASGKERPGHVAFRRDPLRGVLLQPGINRQPPSFVVDRASECFVLKLPEASLVDLELSVALECLSGAPQRARGVDPPGELRGTQQQGIDCREVDVPQGDHQRVARTAERPIGGDVLIAAYKLESRTTIASSPYCTVAWEAGAICQRRPWVSRAIPCRCTSR